MKKGDFQRHREKELKEEIFQLKQQLHHIRDQERSLKRSIKDKEEQLQKLSDKNKKLQTGTGQQL